MIAGPNFINWNHQCVCVWVQISVQFHRATASRSPGRTDKKFQLLNFNRLQHPYGATACAVSYPCSSNNCIILSSGSPQSQSADHTHNNITLYCSNLADLITLFRFIQVQVNQLRSSAVPGSWFLRWKEPGFFEDVDWFNQSFPRGCGCLCPLCTW